MRNYCYILKWLDPLTASRSIGEAYSLLTQSTRGASVRSGDLPAWQHAIDHLLWHRAAALPVSCAQHRLRSSKHRAHARELCRAFERIELEPACPAERDDLAVILGLDMRQGSTDVSGSEFGIHTSVVGH